MASHDTDLPTLRPRGELLERRAVREGWLLIAAGVIFPLFALGAVVRAWPLRSALGMQAWLLVAVGLLVFAGRVATLVL